MPFTTTTTTNRTAKKRGTRRGGEEAREDPGGASLCRSPAPPPSLLLLRRRVERHWRQTTAGGGGALWAHSHTPRMPRGRGRACATFGVRGLVQARPCAGHADNDRNNLAREGGRRARGGAPANDQKHSRGERPCATRAAWGRGGVRSRGSARRLNEHRLRGAPPLRQSHRQRSRPLAYDPTDRGEGGAMSRRSSPSRPLNTSTQVVCK